MAALTRPRLSKSITVRDGRRVFFFLSLPPHMPHPILVAFSSSCHFPRTCHTPLFVGLMESVLFISRAASVGKGEAVRRQREVGGDEGGGDEGGDEGFCDKDGRDKGGRDKGGRDKGGGAR